MSTNRTKMSILYRYLSDILITIPVNLEDVKPILEQLRIYKTRNSINKYVYTNLLDFFEDLKNDMDNNFYDDNTTDTELSFFTKELEEVYVIFGNINKKYNIEYILDLIEKEIAINNKEIYEFNNLDNKMKLSSLKQRAEDIECAINGILEDEEE